MKWPLDYISMCVCTQQKRNIGVEQCHVYSTIKITCFCFVIECIPGIMYSMKTL